VFGSQESDAVFQNSNIPEFVTKVSQSPPDLDWNGNVGYFSSIFVANCSAICLSIDAVMTL